MPGMKELTHFRNELSNLAHEREVTAERGEVYEELPMPPVATAPQLDVDNLLASLGDTDTPVEGESFELPSDTENIPASKESSSVSVDSTGFDDFLSSLNLDESEKPSEPIVSDEDSFAIPADLLSGFADEIEQSRNSSEEVPFAESDMGQEIEEVVAAEEFPDAEEVSMVGEPPTNEAGGFPLPDFNFDNVEMPDFSETPHPENENASVTEFGMGDDSPIDTIMESEALEEVDEPAVFSPKPTTSDIDLPDFGEMDFTPNFEMDGSTDTSAGKDSFENFTGTADNEIIAPTGIPGDSEFSPVMPEPTAPAPDDFSDFSVPDDLNIVEPAATEKETDLDGFDGFSLDADFLKSSLAQGAAESDEFHIPGFSDFTSGDSRPALSEFPTAGTVKKTAKKEFSLAITESEFARFLEILGTYPLNLRLAVEEYLAGVSGTEHHKMELVHNILSGTSIRKIAHILETALDRSIPISKDYEKKTLAEYEKEKASLRYVFFNRILPMTILFIIATTLAACTVFLSWQFIYRPLAAESLYKRGFVSIQDERYTQAIELFDQAVVLWNKKKWYFRYARAFKEKNQYISAELMYERLLDRFNNDKKGGLEYAEMLRTDLRNFEKAETILKRRVLDNHVNDKDGLLLLGDTYLDWAEENPSKFEDARRTYSTLIELYGTQDPFLARMMRYFIRTDKLAQVLPLKEHFMSKKAKIGAQDLTELSGYLLEKRYNPQPGETDFLRNQIEDVRILLERAIKADDSSPEAHYNMGRFLIYNYKNDSATSALSKSLQRFDEAKTMTGKRVLTHVDAFRLLGEVLAENKEYLKAQARYTQGITLYEAQKANRTVRPDPRVGKLYADYADIDYFISGDLDSAFANYTKATEELGDTPSIRYRIGYIQYQKQDYEAAMIEFNRIQIEVSGDKNLLYGFGNTLYRRGDFYAAQGYFEHLIEILDDERLRKGIVFPQVRPDHEAFVVHYLYTANNLGVTLGRISTRTGDSRKNARALALLAESTRAWDALTRNQTTMIRMQGSNLAFLNIQNMTHPRSEFVPEIYADIPKTLENEKILQQRADQ